MHTLRRVLVVVGVAGMAMLPGNANAQEGDAASRLTVSGDARFRLEQTLAGLDRAARFRGRIRFRLSAIYEVSSSLRVGGRLTSGDPDDANSPYQDLGDLFARFPVSLDRVYLTWNVGRNVRVTGGKFGHPFESNPVYGELVWDADVQPEGVMIDAGGSPDSGRSGWRGVLGTYLLTERAGGGDSQAVVAQASGRVALGRGVVLRGALGYYGYGELAPEGTTELVGRNRGNALVDRDGDGVGDTFASDFRILDALLSVRLTLASRAVVLSAQFWRNLGADGERDGWAAGASVGTLRDPGSWRLYYQTQRVEREAVLSPFVQDDFLHATDFDGHVIGATLRVMPRADLNLWALSSNRIGGSDRLWRLRAHMTLGF